VKPFRPIINGWHGRALARPSPNQDDRPDAADINLLVIHNISLPPRVFGGPWIDQLFTNRLQAKAHPYFAHIHALKVSAHLLVRRNGQVIQYVPFQRRAWHAGRSFFDGRTACNDFSIGIELEGSDEMAYTDAQYRALTVFSQDIMNQYLAITLDRIVGHSDIAPERKTDPGPSFDWAKFRQTLSSQTTACDTVAATHNEGY
jgi:N-acetyl-anhydromuramoyl-L-alanine amidase